MNYAQFSESLLDQMDSVPEIPLAHGTKVVVMSDFHAGDGSSRDDLTRNGDLLLSMLGRHYLKRGSILVLNGDIEELQKFRLDEVRAAWPALYSVFDSFAAEGHLYKITGNHDDSLLDEVGYSYPLHPGIRLTAGGRELYVFHGHQASEYYSNYNNVSAVFVRHFLKKLNIKNVNVSRNSPRSYGIERNIYRFCQENRLVSLIGHTHRPLFESLSKYDSLRFAIERLCREYPLADEARKRAIEAELADDKDEFGRLRRRDRRNRRGLSLYGTDLLLPCLFNSGCAVGKKGITAIEIEEGRIALVYWYEEGKAKRYLRPETRKAAHLAGTPYKRAVIDADRLDYLFARIDLLA